MSTAFIPKFPSATSITVAGTSSSASIPVECPQVRLIWSGGANCQVIWGVGAQTATTSHMQLIPGAIEVFGVQNADTIAVIGTGTLYIICGTGD